DLAGAAEGARRAWLRERVVAAPVESQPFAHLRLLALETASSDDLGGAREAPRAAVEGVCAAALLRGCRDDDALEPERRAERERQAAFLRRLYENPLPS